MVLARLSQFTLPYEETPDGFIRGFSRDARYEYEARLSETSGKPEVAEVTVIRAGESWSQPLAQVCDGTWNVVPGDTAVRVFVESVRFAIAVDALTATR
jgi:hypothetical protein